MATIDGKNVNVNYNNNVKYNRGYELTDLEYHTPKDVKKAIHDAQEAIHRLMDMSNGEGNKLLGDLFSELYHKNTDLLMSLHVDESDFGDCDCSSIYGKYVFNFSDVPYVRTMEDFGVIPYEVTNEKGQTWDFNHWVG